MASPSSATAARLSKKYSSYSTPEAEFIEAGMEYAFILPTDKSARNTVDAFTRRQGQEIFYPYTGHYI